MTSNHCVRLAPPHLGLFFRAQIGIHCRFLRRRQCLGQALASLSHFFIGHAGGGFQEVMRFVGKDSGVVSKSIRSFKFDGHSFNYKMLRFNECWICQF